MSKIFARVTVGDFASYQDLISQHDVNSRNERGLTLVHIAIGYHSTDIAFDLIDRGAEINQKDGDGRIELQTALITGQFGIARELLARGADIHNVDRFGNNAIWYAATHPKRDLDLVKYILERGGDPTLVNKAGRSALSAAIERGHEELVTVFLEFGFGK